MKIILVTEEKRVQVVFTPETDYDRELGKVLARLQGRTAEFKRGNFYHTGGGFTRIHDSDDIDSFILVLDEPPPLPPEPLDDDGM